MTQKTKTGIRLQSQDCGERINQSPSEWEVKNKITHTLKLAGRHASTHTHTHTHTRVEWRRSTSAPSLREENAKHKVLPHPIIIYALILTRTAISYLWEANGGRFWVRRMAELFL